jgi:hypothetical protein
MGVNEYQKQAHENRERAIELGQNTYQGNPCQKCGSTEKYVHGWSCVDCVKLRTLNRDPSIGKKYRQSEKGKARWKRYKKTQAYKTIQNRFKQKDYKNNPEKYKVWHKNNYLKHRDAIFAYGLKYNYNLDIDEYYKKLEEQNFKCEICYEDAINLKKGLCIDHDHASGKIRGLICSNCNLALGNAHESILILENMIIYIKKYNEK